MMEEKNKTGFVDKTKVLCKKTKDDEYAQYVLIKDVKIGYFVLDSKGEYKVVNGIQCIEYSGMLYTLEYGDGVVCTPNQYFYVFDEDIKEHVWVKASEIRMNAQRPVYAVRNKWDGQYDIFSDCHLYRIEIEVVNNVTLYSLDVDGNNFTADDFVVHS